VINTTNKLPELLAPAGSREALESALRAGADAVYLGGKHFNARMNAANFGDDDIKRAVDRAHECGARIYVTLNTLILEREYREALDYVARLWESGVDALIAADLGLCREIALNFPDFALHASTQAGVHNAEGARALSSLGFERVVAARELSRENLQAIIDTGIETEIFVHGALCVSHSGQCLFSSLVGGRSGNRGECAQPCRLAYNGGSYPLSLKDNCLAAHIREIIGSGAASLKIEGRMKSPDYVYAVTSAWRRLLDEGRDATEKEMDDLAAVFSRSGFTDGYYTAKIGAHMNGIRSEADKNATKRARIKPYDTASRDEIVTPAREKILPELHDAELKKKKTPQNHILTARFHDPASIPSEHPFKTVYLPLECFDPEKANGVMIPPVVTDSEYGAVTERLKKAAERGAKRALVGNIGHLKMALDAGLIPTADFRIGGYSAQTVEVLSGMGFASVILSPELTAVQMRDIRGIKGAVVYGRIPLMLLEKRLNLRTLTDRRGVRFPVIREGGRDLVLNGNPTYMADRQKTLDTAGIAERHFIFTTEDRKTVENIIKAYKQGRPAQTQNIRRIREK